VKRKNPIIAPAGIGVLNYKYSKFH